MVEGTRGGVSVDLLSSLTEAEVLMVQVTTAITIDRAPRPIRCCDHQSPHREPRVRFPIACRADSSLDPEARACLLERCNARRRHADALDRQPLQVFERDQPRQPDVRDLGPAQVEIDELGEPVQV